MPRRKPKADRAQQRPLLGWRSNVRCSTGKKSYPSEIRAKAELTIMANGLNKREKTPVRAYKCNLCRQWHLTSRS
jgi:hypothetical protein